MLYVLEPIPLSTGTGAGVDVIVAEVDVVGVRCRVFSKHVDVVFLGSPYGTPSGQWCALRPTVCPQAVSY